MVNKKVIQMMFKFKISDVPKLRYMSQQQFYKEIITKTVNTGRFNTNDFANYSDEKIQVIEKTLTTTISGKY